MTSLTPAYGFHPGDVLWVSNKRWIVDAVVGSTIEMSRPTLGHYLAWFWLSIWHFPGNFVCDVLDRLSDSND